MLVIGDSHVRSYSNDIAFQPLFLGPGKEFNFTSYEQQRLVVRTCSAVHKLTKLDSNNVLLVFGEPDTRFALGKGWHPWNYSDLPNDKNKEFVINCAKRYVHAIKLIKKIHNGILLYKVPCILQIVTNVNILNSITNT